METVVFKPSFNAFTFHTISTIGGPVISSRNHSLFKSANYAKTRKFSSSVSLTSPQKGKSPNCDRRNVNSLFKRFWVFFRAFRIKSAQDLGLTLTQKWVSKTQACGETEGVIDGTGFLQNGGIAVALLSVTSSAKVNISPIAAKLAANPTFVAGVLAWFVAQSCKVVLNFFVEKTWDLRILFACGGMPSSHSALCTALTTSVALCHGVADSLFPVCLGFSLIVMYDAIGVRRHAGMQAQVLNLIVEDLFQGHPIRCRKLKELLGHTPLQVFAGALLGFVVAVICHWGCLISI